MTAKPELSIHLITWAAEDPGNWQYLLDRARAADAVGIDRVVVSDHVVYGENLEAYARPELGGSEGGRQPTGPDGCWLEPMTTLAVVAGVTTRLRLGTNILLAALRRPVVLAKTAATLDVLSSGRLDLGIGVGWQKEEYDAAGLDFGDRGRLLDHTLSVCRTLWREQRATFDDDLLHFEAIHQMPKPVTPGGVPIWVSGTVNKRVARRLVAFGSGWIPWGPAAADLRTGIPQMQEAVVAAGGDPTGLQIVGTIPMVKDDAGVIDLERTMAGAPALAEIGATDLRVTLPLPADSNAASDLLADAVVKFRTAVGRDLP